MNNGSLSNRLQRFMQQHAVTNLSLYLILCYAFGYLLQFINPSFLNYLTLNPYAILHGQIWRLLTWVIVPPDSSNIFFILIMLVFYYSIGTSLEKAWGAYLYNVYIFGGMLFTIIGAFIVMLISYIVYGGWLDASTAPAYFSAISLYFSTYYINMSIFLAYATTFPDAVVLFMFILPVKVKWLGIIYAVILALDFISCLMSGMWFVCIAMAASLANFAVFIFRSNKLHRFSPSEIKRRTDFKRQVKKGERERHQNNSGRSSSGGRYSGGGNTWTDNGQYSSQGTSYGTQGASASKMRPPKNANARHRCCICGRTELDDPTLEFRYCSKCQGNWEFCQDHLFHHVHAVNGSSPALSEELPPSDSESQN